MVATLSGHLALTNDDPSLVVGTVPGSTMRIRVADWTLAVFLDFERRWQDHELLGRGRLNLSVGLSGSYAFRQAREAQDVSDHAGYALDNRYDVLKADGQRHMTTAERGAVHALLADYGGALAWGGDYQRVVDEMHVYAAPGQTPATFAALRARLRILDDGTRETSQWTKVTKWWRTGVYDLKSEKSPRLGWRKQGKAVEFDAVERDAKGRLWLHTPGDNWILAAATAYKEEVPRG